MGQVNGWEPVPAGLVRDDDLSLQARAVYPILRNLIWEQTRTNEATMSATLGTLDDIARAVGCSVTALKEYLAELRRRGWLTTTRARRGQPYTYTIHGERTEAESGSAQSRKTADSRARDPLSQTEVDADREPDGSLSGGRSRNLVFDAIAEATGENAAIAGGKIAKAEKAIRVAEADAISEHVQAALAAQPELEEIPKQRIDAWLAEKIKRRARRYRECRDWELTATALATHWLRIPSWEPRTGGPGGMTPSELANLDLG